VKLWDYSRDYLKKFDLKKYDFKKYDKSIVTKHKKLICGIIALGILAFIAWYFFGMHQKEKHNALPVAVAKVKKEDFSFYISALGSVTPQYSVTITAQVSGKIKKIHFADGQNVNAGDLLAEIDSAPYLAQLQQFEGQLARDIALLDNARLDLKRYEKLWDQNSVSKQVYDTQKALVAQYVGTVEIDKGLIDNAKVNLEYCNIKSPISGKISIRLIDEGNVIQSTGQTPIAVVNTVTPITLVFFLSEKYLPKLLKHSDNLSALKVEAYNHDKTELLATGNLIALDNQIDPTTGTIKLKADFSNEDLKLFPNQFANVKLYVETIKDALIIPTAAVQHSNKGTFVYAVTNENKVKIHNIETSMNSEGKTVIVSGVNADDIVVTEGTDKLVEGMLVSTSDNKSENHAISKKRK